MKHTVMGALLALLALGSLPARAQDNLWLQIAARPGEAAAEAAAADYTRRLDGVRGFRLGSSNWYAIVLGPFAADEARDRQRDLRAAGLVPNDAFTTDGASFRAQFWPPDGMAPDRVPDTAAAPAPRTRSREGSVAEARLSERRLSPAERRRVQTALRWAGVYDSTIDGAFGSGTRAAMAAWQAENGFDRTGVLSTAQRTALLDAYDGVLADLQLETVRDETAGISISLPIARVAFDRYEAPFAHYPALRDGDAARVILISRPGDRTTLNGLYDVMQTLEVVPPDGARERRAQSFSITGRNDRIVSQTEVRLVDGAVKGFTLIWPAGREAERRRLFDEMTASFAPLPGRVLDPSAATPDDTQSIDLLAGLDIRQPGVTRSGFYVDARGHVLTTADAAAGCDKITLDGDVAASVAGSDARLGLALLAPSEPLAPRSHARFRTSVPRLLSDVVLAGYSYDGALAAPSLTYGTLADLRGLDGEEAIQRYALSARPGDAGGPILDTAGSVLGMLLPAPEGTVRALPADTAFALDVQPIRGFLADVGIAVATTADAAPSIRTQIEAAATDMTVRVACWR